MTRTHSTGTVTTPVEDVRQVRARLARLDPAGLSDDERLALLSELELLTRSAAGVSVRTQVAFHASQVAEQVQRGVAPSRAGRAAPDDLAQARRTSPYWGSRELTSAKALVTEMPCTLAALSSGDISLYQSRVVTEATAPLDPADRAEVDRRLAGSLPGASTAEIGATVRGLVDEVDPKGFVDRARKAAADRGVSVRPCPDVMALLSARLPAAQAIACHTALKEKAVSMRASGDPRSLAQLMADELFARLTGRTVVDGLDVEVGVVITDSALFDGTSEAADLVGYGPVPAEMARDLLRPEEHTDDGEGDRCDARAAQRPADEAEPDEAQPDETRPDETRPDETQHEDAAQDATHQHAARPDDRAAASGVCPDGARCTSWSCSLLHGSPEATPRAPRTPARPPTDAATRAAKVWLRRLWSDPATGVLTGRDTRRRLFTGALRAALIARDRTCRNTWCGAPVRAVDHKVRARDDGPTSATNGQGLCQRCNNARERPRAAPPSVDDYRPPPPVLPALIADRAPPEAA
ncbi:HNH endonuclease [Ornithinimicrobium pekingense]|uniref:HNH nuclease domain-containing protein n=1 Tax=Ornithinimicrobium pekingense TaxID=384677 RepID=A0ABQ2F543_9MICO|nr:HNH endonuclease signature motif containing protein [Ornithinimicrobium pekingense]GGK61940.1 hypothetical protein GCM10011509_07950 [Ornithinimicrobium pekingense]